jgi:glycine betaine/proline transport system substrate-binding protein
MTSITPNRRAFIGAIGATLLASANSVLAQGLARPDVIIGWTPWSDAEVVTKLAARILRRKMQADVELTLADIDSQFRTMAKGEIDAMLMSWEPDLHAHYLRRHGDELADLGPLYTGTIGLAVPEWVSVDLISSIEDLKKPEVQEALQSSIVGIDPGAGLMAITREAMDAYSIGAYSLKEGTGPKMVREVALAQRRDEPIVVTAWRPHIKFELYGMRYLEDPKGLYSAASTIHARANTDFQTRAPAIADMLSRMSLEISDIEAMMVDARENGIDAAIDTWMNENPDTIQSWIS